DAILALQVRVRETGDEYLTKCLAELTEQRNTALRRLQQLRERVADLRKEGELDTALQLVRDHNAASVKLQGAEELLAELTSECERRDTIENAIRRAHQAIIARDFEGASGAIRSIIKVYGDSPVLTRELQEIETARAEFAKDNLTRAITAARKAYLNGDPAGALATLNNVAPVLEFADPATREEWQRIAESASESTQKTALNTAPNTTINATQSVSFNTSTSLEAPPRPKKSSWIMIAAAAVLVVVAGAVALVMYLSPGKSGSSAGKTPSPAVAGQPQSNSPASGAQSSPSTNAPQPPSGATSTGESPQAGTGNITQLSSKGSDVEDWRAVNASPSLDKIDRYLQLHPNGAFRSQALAKRDDLTWAGAMSADSQASIDSYLQQYPSGKHSQAARTEIARLDGNAINSSNDSATLEAFLRKYPSGNLHTEAENRLDDVDWAQNRKDSAGLQAYLSQFPGGRHAAEARNTLKSLQTANAASTTAAKARVNVPSERPSPSSQGGAADDRSVILGTLKSYQDAYDRQDEGAIERLWPSMTKKQKKDTSNLFKSGVTAIQMTIDVLSGPDISGTEASVTASEIMALSHGGGFDTHTSKVTIKLKKSPAGNAWFIDSIR
ncbi:MAG TPA: hypothetical protein VGS41_06185, partial [Chthonomonadales bacterium]|nr:hypothetical protein [Chthonomonadales bacterium]